MTEASSVPRHAVATAAVVRLVALAATFSAPALVVLDVDSPARTVAVLALFGLAPGAALLAGAGQSSRGSELGLVVAVSLAVTIVVAEAMLLAHLWSPRTATYALAAVCAPLLARGLVRSRSPAEGAA